MTQLKHKTALVTGAAKRLGRAMAVSLARQGVQVAVHYRSSQEQACEVKAEIEQAGGKAVLCQADLADAAQADVLVGRAVELLGRPLDILINSASIFDTQSLLETTSHALAENMQVHAYAPLALSRALADQGQSGHIINMLDSRVQDYDRLHVPYHLSKRSLLALTRMLAVELAPAVPVNAVAPGLILPPEGQGDAYLYELAHTNPLNRHGGPQD
ncbi:MAG: SDR family NAD(P)-dependent oxidoreductase, partial [Planctomycetes bacterium]|nr:SDR family NAD(P)-dependent oxidoreductase [Planctomycetota bacterium]